MTLRERLRVWWSRQRPWVVYRAEWTGRDGGTRRALFALGPNASREELRG